MAEYLRTANGLEVIGGTNVYVEQMTQAEYDDMSQAQQDDNHFRVITDADGEPGLQASEVSSSAVSGCDNVEDALALIFGKSIWKSSISNIAQYSGKTASQFADALPQGFQIMGGYGADTYSPTSGNAYRAYFSAKGDGGTVYMLLLCWDNSNGKLYIFQYSTGTWKAIN